MSPELERALQWWLEVLKSGLCERRSWKAEQSPPVLFCDARGHPAHLGAVLLIDDRCCFTDYAPPWWVLESFRNRRDHQIMGLELLSISLGLCTFEKLIRGRNVVVHSDNTGSEVGARARAAGAVCVCLFRQGGDQERHCGCLGPRAVGAYAVDSSCGAGPGHPCPESRHP